MSPAELQRARDAEARATRLWRTTKGGTQVERYVLDHLAKLRQQIDAHYQIDAQAFARRLAAAGRHIRIVVNEGVTQ